MFQPQKTIVRCVSRQPAATEFLHTRATKLERQLGPGVVHRVAREAQRRYFDQQSSSVSNTTEQIQQKFLK
jgi:hypothetical protein